MFYYLVSLVLSAALAFVPSFAPTPEALTMVVAGILHTVRKEIKYTWKMNLGLLLLAIADAVVIAQIA